MANTYVQIGSTVTVGSGGAANITFSSIPATYTDLIVKLSVKTAGATFVNTKIRFNGVGTGYSVIRLVGNGLAALSSSGSEGGTVLYSGISSYAANTFSNFEHYIPNYAGSTNKSISVDAVSEDNAVEAYVGIHAGLWSNTAAITEIAYTNINGDNFAQHSTASLYGIKKD
jgi:hypothetical protein